MTHSTNSVSTQATSSENDTNNLFALKEFDEQRQINVGVLTVHKILKCKEKVHIPDYQRPYTWSVAQAEKLLDSIIYAGDNECLLGTIVLHWDKDKDKEGHLNIVDGQQRLTTLGLIAQCLDLCWKGINHFKPQTKEAAFRVWENHSRLKAKIERIADKEVLKKAMRETVKLAVIATSEIDQAFVFFNSQNTRGKKLSETDLLKVHHYGYLDEKQKETVIDRYEQLANGLDSATQMETGDNRSANQEEFPEAIKHISELRHYMRSTTHFQRERDEFISLQGSAKRQLSLSRQAKYYSEQVKTRWEMREKDSSLSIESIAKQVPLDVSEKILGGIHYFDFADLYANKWHSLKLPEIQVNGNLTYTLPNNGWGLFPTLAFKSIMLILEDRFQDEKQLEQMRLKTLALVLQWRLKQARIMGASLNKFLVSDDTHLLPSIAAASSAEVVINLLDKYLSANLRDKNEQLSGQRITLQFNIKHSSLNTLIFKN